MTSPTEAEVAELAKLIEETPINFTEIGIARRILAAGYRLQGPPSDLPCCPHCGASESDWDARLATYQEGLVTDAEVEAIEAYRKRMKQGD